MTAVQGFAQNDGKLLVAAFSFFMFNCVYLLKTSVLCQKIKHINYAYVSLSFA